MHKRLLCLLLFAAFPLTALAEESPKAAAQESPAKPETWLCQGSYQTTPGEPLKPQNRTLVLDSATSKMVMKVDGTQYEGQFKVSGQDVLASFEVAGSGDERLVEEVVLSRMKGRLASVVKGKDGARVAQFRGGCSAARP